MKNSIIMIMTIACLSSQLMQGASSVPLSNFLSDSGFQRMLSKDIKDLTNDDKTMIRSMQCLFDRVVRDSDGSLKPDVTLENLADLSNVNMQKLMELRRTLNMPLSQLETQYYALKTATPVVAAASVAPVMAQKVQNIDVRTNLDRAKNDEGFGISRFAKSGIYRNPIAYVNQYYRSVLGSSQERESTGLAKFIIDNKRFFIPSLPEDVAMFNMALIAHIEYLQMQVDTLTEKVAALEAFNQTLVELPSPVMPAAMPVKDLLGASAVWATPTGKGPAPVLAPVPGFGDEVSWMQ